MMLQFIASVVFASTAYAGEPVASLPTDPEVAKPVIVRMYDLAPLMPTFRDLPAERLLPQLVMAEGNEGFWFDEGNEMVQFEEVLDFLLRSLSEEGELEGRLVEYGADFSVIVRGPEETHARFRAVLAAAEDIFSSATSIRIDVFDATDLALGLGQVPTDGVMSIETWDMVASTLVAEGASRTSTTLRLEEGRTAYANDSRYYEFVAGYDVEIAQSSFVYGPVQGTGRVGTRISAQGSPRRGGLGLSLCVQSTSLVGEPELKSFKAGGLLGSETAGASHRTSKMNVVVPTLSTRVFAADAFLPDGHVLLYGGSTALHSGQKTEIVVVRRLDASPPRGGWIEVPGTDRRFLVTAAGAAAPPAIELSSRTFREDKPAGTLIGHLPRNSYRSESFDATIRFANEWGWMEGLVGLGVELDRRNVWSFGPWLIVRGESEATSGVPGPGVFDLGDSEPLTVDLVLRDGDGEQLVNTRVSMRVGGEALAVLGYERTAIPSYDVEVAQYAAVVDPAEHLLFDGMAVHLAASRGPSGALHLVVRLRASLERSEATIVRLDGFEGLEVDSYDHEQFFADERFVLEAGKTEGLFTLGGELGGGTPGLTIQVH